jgi:uncharacterized protein YozE (UPF0346 family)
LHREYLSQLILGRYTAVDIRILFTQQHAFFLGSRAYHLLLLLDDSHTAFDELVLKHSDLVFKSEINTCMYLKQHVGDALADLLLLTINSNFPKNSNSFHFIRCYLGTNLDQVRINFSILDSTRLPLFQTIRVRLHDIIILHDKLASSQVN